MNNLTATVTFKREECVDDSPDLSYLEQDYKGCNDAEQMRAQDALRLAAYKRDDWHMIGVRAVATVTIHDARSRCTHQHMLKSCGLWGIESDSGEAYLAEVYAEECAQLSADIKAMGCNHDSSRKEQIKALAQEAFNEAAERIEETQCMKARRMYLEDIAHKRENEQNGPLDNP